MGTLERILKKIMPWIDGVLSIFLACILLKVTNEFARIFPLTEDPGFFCNDQALIYQNNAKLLEDKTVFIISRFVSPIIIVLLELLLAGIVLYKEKRFRLCQHFKVLRCLVFGNIAITLITNFGRMMLKRTGPNFLNLCKPRFLNDVCKPGVSDPLFRTEYKCSGTVKAMEFMVSFPSSNACFVCYNMIFLVCYIHLRHLKVASRLNINRLKGSLLRPIFQAICIMVACYISLHDVVSGQYQAFDVITGVLLGTLIAIFTAKTLWKRISIVEVFEEHDSFEATTKIENTETDSVKHESDETSSSEQEVSEDHPNSKKSIRTK